MNWRNNNLIVNRPIDINKIGNNWQHNPSHRHGVKYNNADVRQKFARTDAQAGKGRGRTFAAGAASKCSIRVGAPPVTGLAQGIAKAGDRPGAGDRAKAGDRPGAGDRGKAGDRSKVGAGKGGGKPAASRPSRPSGASARQRDTAFSGADRASCPFACRSGAPSSRPAMEEQGASPLAAGLGSGAVAAASAVAEAVSAAAAAGGPISR